MSEVYLYLSMAPEALIASMLPPAEFGTYLATGTRKRSQGQAVYFDLAKDFSGDFFGLSRLQERCVPHPDGQPKHSVYLGIYRVLEHVPLKAVNNLHLTTRDGRTLTLARSQSPPQSSAKYHLYKEICPVHPLIASKLNPGQFCKLITDPSRSVHVPRICFLEMYLGQLADDPHGGDARNLPYRQLDHIRDCLLQLGEPEKHTKTVDRIEPLQYYYRCIEGGFYLGDQGGILHFPFPSWEELERKHHQWLRSAEL